MRVGGVALPLLAVAAVLLAVAAQAGVLSVAVESFEAPVYAKAFEGQVSVAANSTHTINIVLPSGWTQDMVEAIIVRVENATGQVSLSAKDANGTVLATATVVPLSSGYTVTLPPGTAIELANSDTSVWNGTVIIYVQSTAQFIVSGVPSQLNLEAGGSTGFTAHVEQTSGPPGLVYWGSEVTKNGVLSSDITVDYYWAANGQETIQTSGAGWTGTVAFSIAASQQAAGQYTLKLTMYYLSGATGGPTPVAAITGVVNLSGPTTATVGDISANIDKDKLLLGGIAIIVLLAIIALIARR